MLERGVRGVNQARKVSVDHDARAKISALLLRALRSTHCGRCKQRPRHDSDCLLLCDRLVELGCRLSTSLLSHND